MPTSANDDLLSSHDSIRRWQLEDRPLGMPPEEGLLYQPIPFPGYAELACERDSSADRFEMIARVVEPRDESLLDLGCANGYFPFRLAQHPGALREGLGVDHFIGNVKTANHLAERHGLGDVLQFRHGEVSEALLDELLAERRTLVLLLSVHHHMIRAHGVESTQRMFRKLHDCARTVVLEQGSLTQAEYEAWTGRSEPFHTRSFSRFVSMAEAAGIPMQNCFLVGMGRYASGRKHDRAGAGRVLMGLSQGVRTGSVLHIRRKAHKNGIFMELLTVAGADGRPAQVWKNVVTGTSLSGREARALRSLADSPGFARVLEGPAADEADGLLRLRYENASPINAQVPSPTGVDVRSQCIERLMSLASRGWVHGELHAEHVLLGDDGVVVMIDFESARHVSEPFEQWLQTIATPNPALGLGMYERPRDVEGWNEVDLVAMNELFRRWSLAPLSDEERRNYHVALQSGVRTSP